MVRFSGGEMIAELTSAHYRSTIPTLLPCRRTPMHSSALALVLIITPACVAADDGFTPLFNGKDLTGWEIKENRSKSKDPDQWYVKEGGILAAKAGSGWLGTKEQYDDFVLKLEWRIPPGSNSG